LALVLHVMLVLLVLTPGIWHADLKWLKVELL
jgi:hypothetical protein